MNTIVGHETQLRYLKRLTCTGRIPHSLLFTGPEGIGKYTTARYFAQALVCESEQKPCNVCPKCLLFTQNRLMDVIELGTGGSPVKVGQPDEPGTVRHLVSRLSERSFSGGFVVLIKGIGKINESGQNVLLKTIEEPGKGTHIIMTASSRSSVLQTIRSRSVMLDFFPLNYDQICSVLQLHPEHNSSEEAAIIASGGSVSLAEKLIEGDLILKVLDAAAELCTALQRKTFLHLNEKMFDNEFKKIPVIQVFIHLFRYMLYVTANREVRYNALLEKLYIDDITLLHSLIKLLLQTDKEQLFNINIKNSLKSAVYTLIEGNNNGIYMY